MPVETASVAALSVEAAAAPLQATVLVIAYRMPSTIAEAVRSALAQTVPCEILVSDDSSGDGTLEAAQAAAADYAGPHRISVRSTAHNRGLCAHLNELGTLAGTGTLMFLAGDDVSYPQRVERLLAEFARHPQAQLVGSAVDDIDESGRVIAPGVRGQPPLIEQRGFLRAGRLRTVLGASMAVRRTLLTGFPPLVGKVEDNMLSLRAALAGECRCLPEALLGYRRHDNNLGDWVFDRSERNFIGWSRRQQRVAAMYHEIADDQQRCVAARPDLPEARRRMALELATMYRLEAQMREALLQPSRRAWLGPIWRGLQNPGLRRKSAERALKLLLPRRWFGRS